MIEEFLNLSDATNKSLRSSKVPPLPERKTKAVMEATDVAHIEEVIRELAYFESGERSLFGEKIRRIVYGQNKEWHKDILLRVRGLLEKWGSSEKLSQLNSVVASSLMNGERSISEGEVDVLEDEYLLWYDAAKDEIDDIVEADRKAREDGQAALANALTLRIAEIDNNLKAAVTAIEEERESKHQKVSEAFNREAETLTAEIEELIKDANKLYEQGNSLDGSRLDKERQAKENRLAALPNVMKAEIAIADEAFDADILLLERESIKLKNQERSATYNEQKKLEEMSEEVKAKVVAFEEDESFRREALYAKLDTYYYDCFFDLATRYISPFYKERVLAEYTAIKGAVLVGESCATEKISNSFVSERKSADVLCRLFADLDRMDVLFMRNPPEVTRRRTYTDYGDYVGEWEPEKISGGRGVICFSEQNENLVKVPKQKHSELEVFFGAREQIENGEIKEIWATIGFQAAQTGPAGEKRTSELSYVRVRFEFLRWQNKEYMDELDELEDEWKKGKADRRSALNEINKQDEEKLKKKIREIEKNAEAEKEAINEEYDLLLKASHERYIATVEAYLEPHNTEVCSLLTEGKSVEETNRKFNDRKNEAWRDKTRRDREIEDRRKIALDAIADKSEAEIKAAKNDANAVEVEREEEFKAAEDAIDSEYYDSRLERETEIRKEISDKKKAEKDKVQDVADRESKEVRAIEEATLKSVASLCGTKPISAEYVDDWDEVVFIGTIGDWSYYLLTIDYDKLSEATIEQISSVFKDGNEQIDAVSEKYKPIRNQAEKNYINALREIDDFDPGKMKRGVWVATLPSRVHIPLEREGRSSTSAFSVFDFTIVYDRSRTRVNAAALFNKYYKELEEQIKEKS